MLLSKEMVEAARRGEIKRVVKWLRKGSADAQDHTDGDALLHIAVLYGQRELVRELVKRGASINLTNRQGITPLMLACQLGVRVEIEMLLQLSAEVDLQTPDGGTALMTAAAHDQPDAVSLLLAAKAAVDMQTAAGYTALMSAAAVGSDRSAQLLLDAGACVTLTDNLGCTALGCAQAKGRESTVLLLTPSALASNVKLRFAVGDRVRCWVDPGQWQPGRVVQLHYSEAEWPKGKVVPYQVKLDNVDIDAGGMIYTPADDDRLISAPSPSDAADDRRHTHALDRGLHRAGSTAAEATRHNSRSLHRATGLLARAMRDC